MDIDSNKIYNFIATEVKNTLNNYLILLYYNYMKFK